MTYYNTIDIDNGDKANLDRILNRISRNKCCIDINCKDSSNKGYHLILTCKVQCDICRLVFDDQKRLEMDNMRNEKFRNTLFSEKEYFKGNINKLKMKTHYCERCKKFGITNEMEIKKLTLEETIEKLRIGKIKLPIFAKKEFVFLGYSYLECKECKWFKFVQNRSLI